MEACIVAGPHQGTPCILGGDCPIKSGQECGGPHTGDKSPEEIRMIHQAIASNTGGETETDRSHPYNTAVLNPSIHHAHPHDDPMKRGPRPQRRWG